MEEHCKNQKKKKHQACLLWTLVLVGLLILLLILYFSLFKPTDPKVQVPTMQLLSYTTSPQGSLSSSTSASLSLNLQVSIYNPNRGDFIIQQGSIACLFYQNQQVGFTPIPSATIPSQSFSTSSISLSSSSPIDIAAFYTGGGGGGTGFAPASALPIATSVIITGHVTTANLFSHHSDVVSKCKLALSLGLPRAYIQSYTCQSSYSLDD